METKILKTVDLPDDGMKVDLAAISRYGVPAWSVVLIDTEVGQAYHCRIFPSLESAEEYMDAEIADWK